MWSAILTVENLWLMMIAERPSANRRKFLKNSGTLRWDPLRWWVHLGRSTERRAETLVQALSFATDQCLALLHPETFYLERYHTHVKFGNNFIRAGMARGRFNRFSGQTDLKITKAYIVACCHIIMSIVLKYDTYLASQRGTCEFANVLLHLS